MPQRSDAAGNLAACWRRLRDQLDQEGAALNEKTTAVEEAIVKTAPKKRSKPRRQPRYHVILWNDDDHTYDYVIRMMKELFHHAEEQGFKIARQVDKAGRAVCLTTTKEHAELKRDQIHAYGKDPYMAKCKGSMSASIEPEC